MGGRADDDAVANGNNPTSQGGAKLNACQALQVSLPSGRIGNLELASLQQVT